MGHHPARGPGHKVLENLWVEPGRVRRSSKCHGRGHQEMIVKYDTSEQLTLTRFDSGESDPSKALNNMRMDLQKLSMFHRTGENAS